VALDHPTPSFQGRFFEFQDFVLEPRPVQPRMPIWLGGRSERSFRRALPAARARVERSAPALEIVVEPELPVALSGADSIRACREIMIGYHEIGVTGFKLRFRADTLEGFLAQLEIFRHEIVERMPGNG